MYRTSVLRSLLLYSTVYGRAGYRIWISMDHREVSNRRVIPRPGQLSTALICFGYTYQVILCDYL